MKKISIIGALILAFVSFVALGRTGAIETYLKGVIEESGYSEEAEGEDKSFLVIDESYRVNDSVYVKGHLNSDSKLVSVKINGNEIQVKGNTFEFRRESSENRDSKLRVVAALDNGQKVVSVLKLETEDSGEKSYAEKLFLADAHTHLSLRGASLSVDSGLIRNDTVLSITKLTKGDLPEVPAEMVNVTAGEGGYRFLPHGMQFEGDALVSLPYDSTLIPGGYSVRDIRTFYFDENRSKWVALPLACVNSESRIIESRTSHFTDMINALLKTPDSPEGNIFVPTQMKDLKAADPVSGVTMMGMPQANARGSLALQYPISVPAGRQGMTPNVVLSYNSSVKGGWAGEGWNISVSKITVDTRWGVPRYMSDKESESYMLDGERLTPNARKKPFDARVAGDRQFYLEKEGRFAKIIRHGNSPKDYTWEITDKDGRKSLYTVVQSSAVSGTRSEWYLTKETDVNGNTISYSYDVVSGDLQSKEIVLSSIDYTGFEDEKGAYSVKFSYEKGRLDASLDARYGYMCQSNGTLLNDIEVKYRDELLRKYSLVHSDGAFFKKILTSIKELDSEGALIGEHRMTYDNSVGVGSKLKLWEGTEERKISGKNRDPHFVSTIKDHGFNDDYSSLSGSYARSVTGGGALGVGVCATLGSSKAKCSAVVKGTYSHIQGSGEGSTTLVDIDGDGLSDRVVWDGETLYYEKNLEGMAFAEPKEIKGVSHSFSESENWGNTKGLKVSAGVSMGASANAGVGWDKTEATTKIKTYFGDFNGDGLIDLNVDGTVYFNRLENGVPSFKKELYGVEVGEPVNSAYYPDPKDEEAELADQYPLADVVRVWRAPFNGTVRIRAKVSNRKEIKDSVRRDGYNVMIQAGNVEFVREYIPKDDTEEHVFEISDVEVNRGLDIYFRQSSIYNGEQDYALWDIEIDYLDSKYKRKDLNGKVIGHFSSIEDFQLFGAAPFVKSGDGAVSLSAPITVSNQLDSVRVYALHIDKDGNLLGTLFDEKFPPFARTEKDLSVGSLNMESGESIEMFIESDSYIGYDSIDFMPFVTEGENRKTYINPAKKVENLFDLGEAYEVKRDSVVLVSFVLDRSSVSAGNISDDRTFLLYDRDNNIYRTICSLGNAEMWDTIKFTAADTAFIKGGHYTPTLHISKRTNVSMMENYKCVALNKIMHIHETSKEIKLEDGTKKDTIIKDTTYSIEKDIVPMTFYADGWEGEMGSFYRSWGQFQYNANGGRADLPINRDDLKFKGVEESKLEGLEDGVKDINDFNNLGLENPQDKILMPMTIDIENNTYKGGDANITIGGGSASSGRLGLQDIYVPPYVKERETGTLDAPCKRIHSKSHSFCPEASINLPFSGLESGNDGGSKKSPFSGGVSLNKSTCETTSSQNLEVMDMNGDRFPDIVTDNAIQYTDQWGARQPETSFDEKFEINYTEAHSDGGGVGNAFAYKSSGSKQNNENNTINTQNNTNNATSGLSTSATLSANKSESRDTQKTLTLDVNGDGLPDRVHDDGTVDYNIGYGFIDGGMMQVLRPTSNFSTTHGGSLGFGANGGKGAFEGLEKTKELADKFGSFGAGGSFGIGLSSTSSSAKRAFADLNGDGLVDIISERQVYLNIGGKFIGVNLDNFDYEDEGKTNAESVNGGVSINVCIPVWTFVGIEVEVDVNGGLQHSVSSNFYSVDDIDGDGFPDILHSEDERKFNFTKSITGTTNMLRRVEMPFKKSMDFDYELRKPTQEDPYHYQLLKSVRTFDGHRGDGEDSTYVSFEYGKGKYDRFLRENFGFESVISKLHNADNSIHRVITEHYDNTSYFTNGTLLGTETRLGNGVLVGKSTNDYVMLNPENGNKKFTSADIQAASRVFFAKVAEETRQYELGTDTSIYLLAREEYSFDEFGRVTEIKEINNSVGNRTAKVEYYTLESSYIIDKPKDVRLYGEDGIQLRHHIMEVNDKGQVTKLSREFTDKGQKATADIEQSYDGYGNMVGIKYPENTSGQRLAVSFEYDDDVHQFVTRRTDQEGYEFRSGYDTKWGVCTSHTDDNGTQIRYEYDNRCRLTKVLGPKEAKAGAEYTMRFTYGEADDHAYSVTEHYRDDYPTEPLRTVIFADGNGRVLQTKKDITVFSSPEEDDARMMSVTGKVVYDRYGNAVEEYLPSSEPLGTETSLSNITSQYAPIKSSYDILDRKVGVTLPDGAESRVEYALSDEGDRVYIETTQIDALGRMVKQFSDIAEQTHRTIKYNAGEEIATQFEYNGVGELMKVTDTDGNETSYTYDELGRKLSVEHPDVGLTTFEYDKMGNMLSKQTANLRAINKGFRINYRYDYNRLVEIDYPHNPWNKVQYTYGKRGDKHYRGGRLYLVQDASGGTELFFDEMGNVVKNIRTVLISQNDMRTFVSESEFDTWGRTRRLVYPDGEVVDFAYNHAGNLTSMQGRKSAREYPIITRQGYDERENRVYRKYGNGTEQVLDYEPLRNHLTNSRVELNGVKLLDNAYKYDDVDNILSIVNSANIPDFGLGGSYSHSYQYDDLNRLVSASGEAETPELKNSYSLAMKYDSRYSILNKTQVHSSISKSGMDTTKVEQKLDYSYRGDTPSAPNQIGSRSYTYDANGNPTSWTDTATGDFRQMIWDEENRLSAISVNGEDYCYTYDHSGERVVKSSSTNDMLFVNGKFMGSVQHREDFTVYVSPMMTYSKERFTKHYYADGERVSSRIGSGQFSNKFDQAINPVITAGNQNYVRRMALLNNESSKELVKKYNLPPGPATNKGIYEKLLLEGKLDAVENPNYVAPEETTYDIPRGWPKYPVFPDSGDVPGPPIQFEELKPDSVKAGYTFTDPNMIGEVDEYFYHGDHISSVILVTDKKAKVVQQFAYMPFGELLVDNSTVDLDYRFSAKETDRESGLGYFGARYYDNTSAMWLGVDPLWEKNVGASPYNYCHGNPINMVDPDGRDEKQRTQAVEKATEYVTMNPDRNKNLYVLGAKGAPGEPVDCSGLVSSSIIAGGEGDPTKIGEGRGTKRMWNNTTHVKESELKNGYLIFFGENKKEENISHVGIISNVELDENGKIKNLSVIASNSSTGPFEFDIYQDGNAVKSYGSYWEKRIVGYTKWDTKPDVPNSKTKINISNSTDYVKSSRINSQSINSPKWYESIIENWNRFQNNIVSRVFSCY